MAKEYYAVYDPPEKFAVYRTWTLAKKFLNVPGQQNPKYLGFHTFAKAVACCRGSGVSRIPYYEPASQSTNISTQLVPSVERHVPHDGERLDENQGQNSLANYYAVARGHKVSIYDSWKGLGGAEEQTRGFSGAMHKRFDDREAAIRYLKNLGIPRLNIRIFRMAFKQLQTFTPDAAAPFIPELLRCMDSLDMSSLNRGKTKVDAIHALLIQHLLPEGVPVDQEDEEEGIILSDA
ncbi:hypothetical protein CFE70_005856 [Pyrenophora teres f. teres 0-1]|uniref:Ribonuclease H1 N-terminal domain-containing protein n=2 Tax=Pyrenophora teres f. teres TaxID=97479 RepID=E3RU04_PYRTT|nr:hypothetical protein PTT_12540 [Pyrenophora teres f. teres 0-1]KAK1919793.1 hypothetical protein P3342_002086 [Pyrenophora teres f. teres]CAE7178371.1 Cauli VI domain containing protein [Pyrenophora teres f. teres]